MEPIEIETRGQTFNHTLRENEGFSERRLPEPLGIAEYLASDRR